MVSSKKLSLFSALLLGACLPAFAQTPTGTPPSPAAAPNPAEAGPAADHPTESGSATGAQAAQAAPGKAAPVCFKLTGRCVESSGSKQGGNGRGGAQTPATQGAAPGTPGGSASKPGSSGGKPLNLTAPDVRSVVPAEELKEPRPTTEQIVETQEDGTVSVKGEQAAPDVPGGFGALWWALNHPSQAWRIFAPAE